MKHFSKSDFDELVYIRNQHFDQESLILDTIIRYKINNVITTQIVHDRKSNINFAIILL